MPFADGECALSEHLIHRCFIGVPMAGRLLSPLKDLRRRVLHGTDARPVPDANLHLTLVFLGNLSTGEMGRAVAVIRQLAISPAPGLQPLTRAGGFPGIRSRMVAVEGEATPVMAALVTALRVALQDAGLPGGDDRPFRPHITLAKRPRGGSELRDHDCELWLPVEEMVLYESVPLPEGGGVEYRVVARREVSRTA